MEHELPSQTVRPRDQWRQALLRLNTLLFVLVAAGFPFMKVVETFRLLPLPVPSLTNPSDCEIKALGVESSSEWGYADQLGYGLLRRFDDSNYWLLLGLILANRAVLQVRDPNIIPKPPSRSWWLALLLGLLFVVAYLAVVAVEGGTFFSYARGLTGWRYWGLQVPEGVLNLIVVAISGVCVVLYFEAIHYLSQQPSPSTDVLEKVRQIGYTPLLIVTLFSAAVGFIGVELDSADRVTLVVVQLVLLAGSYLGGLAYAKWKLPRL